MKDKEHPHDALLEAVAQLPREIQPSRDLWPDIAAHLVRDNQQNRKEKKSFAHSRSLRIAASFMGAALGVLLAAYFSTTRHTADQDEMVSIAAAPVASELLPITQDEQYRAARAQLAMEFAEGLQALPRSDRAQVEKGLKDIQNGLRALNEALQRHPDNLSLRRLILSGYQRELEYMQSIDMLTESVLKDTAT